MQETWVYSLGREDSLEEGMANPLQYSCRQNPMDGGAWRAAVHRAAQSQPDWSEKAAVAAASRLLLSHRAMFKEIYMTDIRRIYIYINKKLKKK